MHAQVSGKFCEEMLSAHDWWSNDTTGSWGSQFGQDASIVHLFDSIPGPRFFVDLAANHAVYLSNTRSLERDHGWAGLCIEGNAELVRELQQVRRCFTMHAVVGSWNEAVTFRMHPRDDGLSRVASGTMNGTQTATVPLAEILASAGAPRMISYLSLDVEGAEDAVLLGFPFDAYQVQAMTIEKPSAALCKRLVEHGYVHAFEHGWGGDQLWLSGQFPGGVVPAIARARDSSSLWAQWFCSSHDPKATGVSTHRRFYHMVCDDQRRYLEASAMRVTSKMASELGEMDRGAVLPFELPEPASQTIKELAATRSPCLFSCVSADGIGHQAHARLSCLAAAALLREEAGKPGASITGARLSEGAGLSAPAFEYIRQPWTMAEHSRPSELTSIRSLLGLIEAGARPFDSRTMSLVPRRSASLRPWHEERADHYCAMSNRNASLLVQWLHGQSRALCNPETVFSADNCFELLACGGRRDAEATLPELVSSASRAWARVGSEVQARYHAARPAPPSHQAPAAVAGHGRRQVSIAVHIRRGDTVRQTHRHMGDAMLAYFNRTVSMLRTRYARVGHVAKVTIVTDEDQPHWVYNQSSGLPSTSDAAYGPYLTGGGFRTSFGTWSQRTAVRRLFGGQPHTAIADGAQGGASLERDLGTLVDADVLVISLSSLSYTAALLRVGGTVVAPSCMHAFSIFVPLAHWELAECCPVSRGEALVETLADESFSRDQGRRLSRTRRGAGTLPPPQPSFWFC